MSSGLTDNILTIRQPPCLVFGCDAINQFEADFLSQGFRSVLIVTAASIRPLIESLLASLQSKGVSVVVYDAVASEPTIGMLEDALAMVRTKGIDAVAGIGGGSVLDLAKLITVLLKSDQSIHDIIGIGKVSGRSTYMACLPTTAGTGSEVSPNAILLDEKEHLKKGVVSPFLIADAAYIDPKLTLTVPPDITAATGIDTLTHCIEAYANLHAHPIVDIYALEGIRLVSHFLPEAYKKGKNLKARAALSLASMYGGLCLGPVNTGGVHALSYPLGGEYHIPHGLANAVLLPGVFEFNLTAMPDRYAEISLALGVEKTDNDIKTAQRGLERIRQIYEACEIPMNLPALGVPGEAVEELAASAMTVTRLLKNNPREMALEDAIRIYRRLF